MKKSLLFLTMMLLSMMVMAEVEETTIDGIRYRVNKDTQTAMVAYADYKSSATIPAVIMYQGAEFPVTYIFPEAFAGRFEMRDIYCYATCVPFFDGLIIDDTARDNITVHVPALVVEYYKKADGWRNFKAIVPMTNYDGNRAEVGTFAPKVNVDKDLLEVKLLKK